MHARVRRDMYKLPVRPEGYAAAAERITVPLCYNGDVFTPEAAERITARFAGTHALMLGRGLIADPALAREISGGGRASRSELREFHDLIYDDGCQCTFSAGDEQRPCGQSRKRTVAAGHRGDGQLVRCFDQRYDRIYFQILCELHTEQHIRKQQYIRQQRLR